MEIKVRLWWDTLQKDLHRTVPDILQTAAELWTLLEILKGDGDKLSFKLVLQVQLTFEHVQSEHEFDSAD